MALNLKGFGEAFSQSFNKTFSQTLEDLLKRDAEKRKEKKAKKVRESASKARFNLMRELASDEVKKEIAGKFSPKIMTKDVPKEVLKGIAKEAKLTPSSMDSYIPDKEEIEAMSPDDRMKAALKSEKALKGKDKAGIMRNVMSDLLRIEGDEYRAEKRRQQMRAEKKQDDIEAEGRAWDAWKKRDDHTRDRDDVERLAREAEEEERYRRRSEESEALRQYWYDLRKQDSIEQVEQGLLKNQTIHAAQAYFARNPNATASSFSVATGLQLDPQLLTAIHSGVRNSPNPKKIAMDAAMNRSEAFKAVQRTAPDYAASQQKFDEWMGRNLGAAGRSGRRGNQGFLRRQGLTPQQIAEALKPSADRSDEFRDFIFNKGVRWFELEEELSQGNQGQTTVRLTDSAHKLGEMVGDIREPTAAETGRKSGQAEVAQRKTVSKAEYKQAYGTSPFTTLKDADDIPYTLWNPSIPKLSRTPQQEKAADDAIMQARGFVWDSKINQWVKPDDVD